MTERRFNCGHPRNRENTYSKSGKDECLICKRARARRYQAKIYEEYRTSPFISHLRDKRAERDAKKLAGKIADAPMSHLDQYVRSYANKHGLERAVRFLGLEARTIQALMEAA